VLDARRDRTKVMCEDLRDVPAQNGAGTRCQKGWIRMPIGALVGMFIAVFVALYVALIIRRRQ